MAGEANTGGILSETFAILTDNARDAALFVLVVGGLSAFGVLSGFYEPDTTSMDVGFMLGGETTPANGAFELIAFVVYIVAGYLLSKRFLASRNRLGTSGNRFWQYLGMAILAGLGIVLGMVLLFVPGLILLTRWTAATGFAIGAQRGPVEALTASWHATKGHGWAIFFAGLVLLIGLIAVLATVAGGISAIDMMAGMVIASFLEAVMNTATYAFAIAVFVLVSNEGENLQEVFS